MSSNLLSVSDSSPRKPSEAKSVDSGYCGPSRETSTVLLRKNSDLPVVKEGIRISTQSLSSSHNVSSSFTNIIEEEAVNSEASELHFVNVPNYQSVASTEASQPSVMHFNESHLPLSLTLSSSGSPSQKSILHITVTSSGESQSQPNTCHSSSTSVTESIKIGSTRMTAEHESILMTTVKRKVHFFTEHTHFDTLLSYLSEKNLVNSEECERLETFLSNKAKANHFYLIVLPRKGKHAYRRLYKCLQRETEHLGHRDLVEILDRALEEQQSPQSSSDSSPTDSNSADRNFSRKSDDYHGDGVNGSPSSGQCLSCTNDHPPNEDNPTGFTNQSSYNNNPQIGSIPPANNHSTDSELENKNNDQVERASLYRNSKAVKCCTIQ